MIRVRIAPSPTGPLHVGTARTALFNYLFAQKHGGKFVLRIEDTDLERSDKKYEKDIFEGLKWLGIEADESPERGGKHGPYRQSERRKIYEKYLDKLLKERKAFYCPHSEEELEDERKKQMGDKEPPRHICPAREQNLENGIIRFKNLATGPVRFDDLIRGEVSFDPKLLGDFLLAKDIRTPLYNFAVVVDDETMKISHVIRGEDHISNTPKQLLLIEALGFKAPEYAHLPLILGPDRSKLSKRHGATSVGEYRDLGYLPEALFNFMALIGWNPGGDKEIFSKKELISEFALEKVQKSGAIFDINKLDWMNGEYIRALSPEAFLKRAQPFLPESKKQKSYLLKVLVLEQPRLKKLSEMGERTDYFFREPEYDKELLRWKNMRDEEIAASLDKAIELLQKSKSAKNLEKIFFDAIGEGLARRSPARSAGGPGEGGDKGRILWPLRVALTGKKASPGPFEIMEILGIEESKKRLEAAKEKLRD